MTNTKRSIHWVANAAVLCGLFLVLSGCRKPNVAVAEEDMPKAVIAPELRMNGVGSLPGEVYQSQATSAIHWQPWTAESFERANAANRLVFAVVAMPQDFKFKEVMERLARDSNVLATINERYVPVLVDGDASREIGLLCADLCGEIQQPVQFPLFIWLTPERMPVAWVPMVSSPADTVAQFSYSNETVSRMWSEDAAYIRRNSGMDNDNRRQRMSQRKLAAQVSTQPAEDSLSAIDRLAGFYDSVSRNLDNSGGCFPSGALDLLSTVAAHPGLPKELRARCLGVTHELMADLLPSAMFDPLDGGVFASRARLSWALPNFQNDCFSQARAVTALGNVYRATNDARVLEKMLAAISYAEKQFMTSEGLFAAGMSLTADPSQWLWKIDDIKKALSAEDADWWIKLNGVTELGNLPMDADPSRSNFRLNSLGFSQTTAELAKEQSQSIEEFSGRLERIRNELLQVRNRRLGNSIRNDSSYATSSFLMVSAYASAFGVTGDVSYRDKAVALLEKSKVAFADGPRLNIFSKDAPKSIRAGRAFHYGLALQAGLDVSDITLDRKWTHWSEDLATTATESFVDSSFLKECPDDAKVLDLPITDLSMLFGESTAGVFSSVECRLAAQKRPPLKSFSDLVTPLPKFVFDQPMVHTDLLSAMIARHYPVTLLIGANLTSELKLAVQRLPLRVIQRREAVPDEGVPDGSVSVSFAGREGMVVSTPKALLEALQGASLQQPNP